MRRAHILAAVVPFALAAFTFAAPPAEPRAAIHWQFGPRTLTLRGLAALPLQRGLIAAQDDALREFLTATGNPLGGNEVAVVGPANLDWFLVFSYDKYESLGLGGAEPSIEEIVAALKRGNSEANAARRRAGRETLDLLGWRERPSYNAATHRLEWSIATQESGGRHDGNRYWLYLTRSGFLTVELVTEQERFAEASQAAGALLARLDIVEQEEYADPRAHDWLLILFGGAAVVLPLAGFGAVYWFTRRRRKSRAADPCDAE
jgi:uncharacterized membrane-anchored protein